MVYRLDDAKAKAVRCPRDGLNARFASVDRASDGVGGLR
jgi:hypothetical protein